MLKYYKTYIILSSTQLSSCIHSEINFFHTVDRMSINHKRRHGGREAKGTKGAISPNRTWTRSWDSRKSDKKCRHAVKRVETWEASTVKIENNLCGYFLKIRLQTWWYMRNKSIHERDSMCRIYFVLFGFWGGGFALDPHRASAHGSVGDFGPPTPSTLPPTSAAWRRHCNQ